MIVLGQHVLAHHLLNDDVDGGGDYDDGDSGDNIINKNNNDATEKDDDCHSVSLSVPPSSFSIIQGEMHQQFEEIWNDARMKVNSQLGLIGAPPLSSSLWNQSRKKKLNVYPSDDDLSLSLYQKNVECICSMVSKHAQLLQTMHCIIEQTLTMGSSMSLGLGPMPTGCVGNGRLVARAEKSWIAKHRQQQHQRMIVKLSLQKIRTIMHQTIIDQSKSLQLVLDSFITTDTNNNAEQQQQQQQQQQQCELPDVTEWDDFVLDIQQPNTILTVSQLSTWINRLGELLSFTLSTIFDTIRNDHNSLHLLLKVSIISRVDYSSKFANERIIYLHSACPSSSASSSSDSDNHRDTNDAVERNVVNEKQEDDHAATTTRRRRRQAESLIRNIQATLDGARICLWEFEQSYSKKEQTTGCAAKNGTSEEEEEDVDTIRESWSQLKDMMERSHSTISDFEDRFLSSTFSNSKDEQDAATNENSIQEDVPKAGYHTNESSEHVSNATIIKKEGPLRIEPQYPIFATNKTLVFSGSGIQSQSKKQVSEKSFEEEEQGISSLSQPSSRAFNAVDQVMLLQDLQKRIRTMGLVAEEHEVVNMDDTANVGESDDGVVGAEEQQQVSTSSGTKKRSSQSCFLGVSGSLLAELSSTINNGAVGEVVGGDSNEGII